MRLASVCIHCGSNPGLNPAFTVAARDLGAALAAAGIRVIFGGVRTGLMGSLADAALEHGGQVVGVLPRFMVSSGLTHEGLSDVRIVASMAERKAVMLELSDGVIMLPGGVGTQDEFWEVLAAAQLGLHAKPCGMLNSEGYYDSLLAFIDHAVREGFFPADERNNIVVAEEPKQLIAALSKKIISSEGGLT
jgi:uncharacterized protein (TIGR00730 family)